MLYKHENKKDFFKYLAVFVLGSLGYAFAVCVMYLFCFSEKEMEDLMCFGRYMGTFLICEAMLLVTLALRGLNKSRAFAANKGFLLAAGATYFRLRAFCQTLLGVYCRCGEKSCLCYSVTVVTVLQGFIMPSY